MGIHGIAELGWVGDLGGVEGLWGVGWLGGDSLLGGLGKLRGLGGLPNSEHSWRRIIKGDKKTHLRFFHYLAAECRRHFNMTT